MAYAQQQQQHVPGQQHEYPTPVPSAKQRFIELLKKHGLPTNKFINENIEIGIEDLTNLDHHRFVELCNFFKLNPIEKIRFEKLVNELCDGEQHFINKPSIDQYNQYKTIPTSKNESNHIKKLDTEHKKMQTISQLAEFMLTTTNSKCDICHQQIDKIFNKQKENLINILNNKKQELHENVREFKEKQLLFIQNQFKFIDEYQAEIRQTRDECSNVLESQDYGQEREDTISQIIQSLLSIHAKHNNYRNVKELNKNLGEMSKEINIEYEPMMIESCIDKLIMIESSINDDIKDKITEINKLCVDPSIDQQISHLQHGSTRGGSFEEHKNNHLNSPINQQSFGASQSMYQLNSNLNHINHINNISVDMFNDNHNNFNIIDENRRASSYSPQIYHINHNKEQQQQKQQPPIMSNIQRTKRASYDGYNHFSLDHANNNNVSYPNQANQANQPSMRNRPHSFAYNDHSYPPITFNGNVGSNPMLPNGINHIDINSMSPISLPLPNGYQPQSQSQSNPALHENSSIPHYSPPFGACQPNHHSPPFGSIKYSVPANNNNNNNNNNSPPFSYSQLPISGYNHNVHNNVHNMDPIQMQNSINSNHSTHSRHSHHSHHNSHHSHHSHHSPPVLSQSESNHENDADIQALIQELVTKHDGDDDDDDDDNSIEAMFDPGKIIPTPNEHNTADNNDNNNNNNNNNKLNGNIDITSSDFLDCNPIEILQDYNKKEQDELNGKSPFMDSIALHIENRRISNNSQLGSSPASAESRSRPLSIHSASSQYTAKWAVYGVGNNMSYEFGLNHNNNIPIFEQMDWSIDDTKATNAPSAYALNMNNNNDIGDIHDEEDEKKEVIDQENMSNGITSNGVIHHRKIWNDCLRFMTNGPGWHMYLFGGGGLYCSGSNASGCFSMGKDRKGTYIQTLTQHSYFSTNDINIRYLSSGCSGHHSFVMTDCNDIYGMGAGSHYQLALDDEEIAKNKHNYWPLRINYFDSKVTISRIGCGKKFSIFVAENGSVWSCGTNLFGSLGFGDEITTLKKPKVIDRLKRAKAKEVVCGENHSVVLDGIGRVWTFGINNQGQLGRNTKNNLDYPAIVHISSRKFSVGQSHSRMSKISSGWNHVAVISESHKLFIWGSNDRGQLGDGTQKVRYKAKPLLKNEEIKDIECGANHTVILTKKRKVWVCGCNEYYQCQQQNNKQKDKQKDKKKNNNKSLILKPRLLTFENQPDIDQQIKRIFAGHNSTFVAVDTAMEILRVCV